MVSQLSDVVSQKRRKKRKIKILNLQGNEFFLQKTVLSLSV